MKKKKYFFILFLILTNIALIVNIFHTQKIKANNENCCNKNKVFANHDIMISEGKGCSNLDNSTYGIGRMLFSFYGTDAYCYDNSKTEIQKQKCLKTHIWGSKGTMQIGGNWVIRSADRVFFNGYDSSRNHWWMTTTTEPLGNALGLTKNFSKKTANIRFGNDLVIGNDLIFNEVENEDPDTNPSHVLHFPRKEVEYYEEIENEGIKLGEVSLGPLKNLDKIEFYIESDYNDYHDDKSFEIKQKADISLPSGASSAENDFLYKTSNGINIDGTAKIHATTTFRTWQQLNELRGSTEVSEIQYKKQYAWNYHLFDPTAKTSMQTREKFVGYNPIKYKEFPPYLGKFYPQPYAHFRVVNYKAVSQSPSDRDNIDEGDICTSVCAGHRNSKESLEIRNNINDDRRDCNNNNVACVESCETSLAGEEPKPYCIFLCLKWPGNAGTVCRTKCSTSRIDGINLGNGGCAEEKPVDLPEVFRCNFMCEDYYMDELRTIP